MNADVETDAMAASADVDVPEIEFGDLADDETRLRIIAQGLIAKRCSRKVIVWVEGRQRLVRCGSRLSSVCRYCARIYAGDWRAILRDGVFDAGPGYRYLLLTLSAPSFGKVHHVPSTKKHARRHPCACGQFHHSTRDEHLRGIPIDPDDYDHDAQVFWNANLGTLWDRTRARLRDMFDGMAYAAVREWQARGALHVHVLIRVPAGEWVDPNEVARIAGSVKATLDDGDWTCWGSSTDARPIRADESTAKTLYYLTKSLNYLLKGVADGGGAPTPQAQAHWAALSRAANRMVCPRCPSDPHRACRSGVHYQWGSRASVVTVSRQTKHRAGWSLNGLTRTSQRQARIDWAKAHQAPVDGARVHPDSVAAQARELKVVAWARAHLANGCVVPQHGGVLGGLVSRRLVGGREKPHGESDGSTPTLHLF